METSLGTAIVKQTEVTAKIREKRNSSEIYDYWLRIESFYEARGWRVVYYRRPAIIKNEAYFAFNMKLE